MPAANQRISEYILEYKLGSGSFGEVWRAHHAAWLDQLVAVKIPTNPQYVRNLQQEGSAIHGLIHPNIVRAINFDPYADPPYLVLEYVPGKSLRQHISDGRLTADDATAILRQVLAGLAYAHERGIVHRDVKPENILIHERADSEGFASPGVVKVTDFGLGLAFNKTAVGSIQLSMEVGGEAASGIAGTLDYMPPEQRSGAEVDARADLYACGVVLYEMLTGERPAGTDLPSDIKPGVPKHLDEVFRRSYARLDRRFASAAEFAKALAPQPPPLPGQPNQPMQASRKMCPQCRGAVEPGDQFCIHCGVQLVPVIRRCHKCGAYPDVSDKFCLFCGTSFMPQTARV